MLSGSNSARPSTDTFSPGPPSEDKVTPPPKPESPCPQPWAPVKPAEPPGEQSSASPHPSTLTHVLASSLEAGIEQYTSGTDQPPPGEDTDKGGERAALLGGRHQESMNTGWCQAITRGCTRLIPDWLSGSRRPSVPSPHASSMESEPEGDAESPNHAGGGAPAPQDAPLSYWRQACNWLSETCCCCSPEKYQDLSVDLVEQPEPESILEQYRNATGFKKLFPALKIGALVTSAVASGIVSLAGGLAIGAMFCTTIFAPYVMPITYASAGLYSAFNLNKAIAAIQRKESTSTGSKATAFISAITGACLTGVSTFAKWGSGPLAGFFSIANLTASTVTTDHSIFEMNEPLPPDTPKSHGTGVSRAPSVSGAARQQASKIKRYPFRFVTSCILGIANQLGAATGAIGGIIKLLPPSWRHPAITIPLGTLIALTNIPGSALFIKGNFDCLIGMSWQNLRESCKMPSCKTATMTVPCVVLAMVTAFSFMSLQSNFTSFAFNHGSFDGDACSGGTAEAFIKHSLGAISSLVCLSAWPSELVSLLEKAVSAVCCRTETPDPKRPRTGASGAAPPAGIGNQDDHPDRQGFHDSRQDQRVSPPIPVAGDGQPSIMVGSALSTASSLRSAFQKEKSSGNPGNRKSVSLHIGPGNSPTGDTHSSVSHSNPAPLADGDRKHSSTTSGGHVSREHSPQTRRGSTPPTAIVGTVVGTPSDVGETAALMALVLQRAGTSPSSPAYQVAVAMGQSPATPTTPLPSAGGRA